MDAQNDGTGAGDEREVIIIPGDEIPRANVGYTAEGIPFRPGELVTVATTDDIERIVASESTSGVVARAESDGHMALRLAAGERSAEEFLDLVRPVVARLMPDEAIEQEGFDDDPYEGTVEYDRGSAVELLAMTTCLNYLLPPAQNGLPGWGPHGPARATTNQVALGAATSQWPVAIFDTGLLHTASNLGAYTYPNPSSWVTNHGSSDELYPHTDPDPAKSYDVGAYDGHGEAATGIMGDLSAGVHMFTPTATDNLFDIGQFVTIANAALDNGTIADTGWIYALPFGVWASDVNVPALKQTVRRMTGYSPNGSPSNHSIVVAAVGNQGHQTPPGPYLFPAAMAKVTALKEFVVAVAALDANQNLASFSNCAPWARAGALGEDVVVSYVDGNQIRVLGLEWVSGAQQGVIVTGDYNGSALWSGTSFATPRVARALAINPAVISAIAAQNTCAGYQVP